MFAVVGRWKLDPSQVHVQREVLTGRIVPGVRQAEGSLAGCWSELKENGRAHSFIVFDERRRSPPSVAPLDQTPCRGRKARSRGLSLSCAEEDSNLHPVIPDQALNLVTRVSYPSNASIPSRASTKPDAMDALDGMDVATNVVTEPLLGVALDRAEWPEQATPTGEVARGLVASSR